MADRDRSRRTGGGSAGGQSAGGNSSSGVGGMMGTIIVGGEKLNVRSLPGMQGEIVGGLSDGERVQVLGNQGNWFKVKAGGTTGWVFSKYVALRAEPVAEGGPSGEQAPRGQTDADGNDSRQQPPGEREEKRPGFFARLFGAGRRDRDDNKPRDDDDDNKQRREDDRQGGRERMPGQWPRELRSLLGRGNLSAQDVQRARGLIEALPTNERGAAFQALQAATPYFNQLDNDEIGPRHTSNAEKRNLGPITCNLTALAMCLQLQGVPNPDPKTTYPLALEHIRQQKFPSMDRKSYDTWARLCKHLGASLQHIHQGDGLLKQSFWMGAPRAALQSGGGVLVSIIGHIVRIQEITKDGIVVDDPYGASKLLPGKTKSSNYTFKSHNGNDNLWPWADVEAHGFRYVGVVKK